jgi:predicted phage terminase large subunit-like protein
MAVDPLGRDLGEALWPDYYSCDVLLDLKATLPKADWNALYKGRPTLEEGAILKSEWFRRYADYPRNERDALGNLKTREVRRVTLSVDTANKVGARNNYTVITVWIETFNGYHYLVDVKRQKVEYNELITLIEDTMREWGATSALVEDAGNGATYIQQRAGKAPCPVIKISAPNLASKEFRFDGVMPMFEGGRVLLPKWAPWLADYEQELLQFPDGTYDDQVDSTAQYLEWASKRTRRGTQKLAGTTHRPTAKAVLLGPDGQPIT